MARIKSFMRQADFVGNPSPYVLLCDSLQTLLSFWEWMSSQSRKMLRSPICLSFSSNMDGADAVHPSALEETLPGIVCSPPYCCANFFDSSDLTF